METAVAACMGMLSYMEVGRGEDSGAQVMDELRAQVAELGPAADLGADRADLRAVHAEVTERPVVERIQGPEGRPLLAPALPGAAHPGDQAGEEGRGRRGREAKGLLCLPVGSL